MMKKVTSLLISIIMLLSFMPTMSVAALTEGAYPQHLSLTFDTQADVDLANVEDDDTVSLATSNAHRGGALAFSTYREKGAPSFDFRAVAGNTYTISFWLRIDKELVGTDKSVSVVFRNPTLNGGSAENQVTATATTPLSVGTWTNYTCTYTPDGRGNNGENYVIVEPNGTVEIRLGGGMPNADMPGAIAYALDDLMITPDADNNQNLVVNGGMNSQVEMDEMWTTSNCDAASLFYSIGANGTKGAARLVSGGTWGDISALYPMNVEIDRPYELTFWARTLNGDANTSLWAIFSYEGEFFGQAAGATQYRFLDLKQVLTTDWKQYTCEVAVPTTEGEELSNVKFVGIRANAKAQQTTQALDCLIDEVALKPQGDANFTVAAQVEGSLQSGGVTAYLTSTSADISSYAYRWIEETATGDVCVAAGTTTGNTATLTDASLANSSVRFEVLGINAYGDYSSLYTSYLQTTEGLEDTADLRLDNYIWSNDIPELSATLTYNNETYAKKLKLVAALYGANNQLLKIEEINNFYVGHDAKVSQPITIDTVPEATKAKFFAWHQDTLEPVTKECEITKITDGEFVYVDVNSTKSSANGSYAAPFKTLESAKTHVRSRLKASSYDNIYVVLFPGEYNQDYQTFELTQQDYSTSKNVIYTSLTTDQAKITGAKHLSGSDFTHYSNGIYVANVPSGTYTRQLFVNGIKATRARTKEDAAIVNADEGKTASNFSSAGITSTDSTLTYPTTPNKVEFVFKDEWAHSFFTADNVSISGSTATYKFTDTDKLAQWQGFVTNTDLTITDPVYAENSLTFLDEEGEWFLHTSANKLYYKPRSFETMDETLDVVLPITEKLLSVKGSIDKSGNGYQVSNISFKNLSFEYSTWDDFEEQGYFRTHQNLRRYIQGQSDSHTDDVYIPGAVEVLNGKNILFDNCDFKGLGSVGLAFSGGIDGCKAVGNEFTDISASAIMLGDVSTQAPKKAWSSDAPYNYIQTVQNCEISNNYIHKVATDFNSTAGISVGFPRNTVIRNNEITDVSYSGIHVGWGWADAGGDQYSSIFTDKNATENLVIEKNYIHNVLNDRIYDGGAIYTLGNTGAAETKSNKIQKNYVTDVKGHSAVLYPDEGSCGWTITENVVDTRKHSVRWAKESNEGTLPWLSIWTGTITDIVVNNNYSTTSVYGNSGTNITFNQASIHADGNWPSAAQTIINEAGIEEAYRSRFDFDVQALSVPKVIELKTVIGTKTHTLALTAETSKDASFDPNDVTVEIQNNNEDIVTVSGTTITAKAVGKAWITLKITRRENGRVIFYDEQPICVVVARW